MTGLDTMFINGKELKELVISVLKAKIETLVLFCKALQHEEELL